MIRKTWMGMGTALVLVVLLLAAMFYASPWWAVHQLKQAARERDVDAVLAGVDQPAVRQSVRLALGFRLAEMQPGTDGQVADPLADTLSSPTLLMSMLLQGHPSSALARAAPAVPVPPATSDEDWPAELHYLDRSTVEVRSANAPDAGSFILRRKGLVDWKLSGLRLPG